MSVADVVVLVAAVLASMGAVVALVAAWILVGQVRRLERGIEALRHEAVPLVREAREAAGHAASEIARVDAVLADTEAVTATVDRAARVARRAFANPVVKVLAWRAGAAGAWRRLGQPSDAVTALDTPVVAREVVVRDALARDAASRRATPVSSGSRRRGRVTRAPLTARPT